MYPDFLEIMKGLAPSNKQIEQLLEQHNIFLTNLHHDQPANNHVQHIAKREEYQTKRENQDFNSTNDFSKSLSKKPKTY